jgi:hypothetical protein
VTITAEQTADLQVGDIVRYTGHAQANGATIEGPVYQHADGSLRVGPGLVIRTAGGAPIPDTNIVLAFVSKAQRPLYVNHSRTEPVGGDVARLVDSTSTRVWFYASAINAPGWYDTRGGRFERPASVSLRLLVDGATGQPVP